MKTRPLFSQILIVSSVAIFVYIFAGLIMDAQVDGSFLSPSSLTDSRGTYPNTVWILFCTVLVVSMQLGFALLESGLVDAKIVISVFFKNTLDFCAGIIIYALIGYYIQFGEFPLSLNFAKAKGGSYDLVHPYAHFLYQAAFATTASTICSGALAGRMSMRAYIFYTMFITGILYPCAARLIWEVLTPAGTFHDLAGSIAVHAVGGVAAFVGVKVVGPRIDRTAVPHNVPLAVSGMFVLFIGWFGFNMGSVGLNVHSAEGQQMVAFVGFNTAIAGVFGGLTAWLFGKLLKNPRLTVSMNGVLGGLVAVTCCADVCHPIWAAALGVGAGALISCYGALLERRNIGTNWFDDPVSAVPVHLACGVMGGVLMVFIPSSGVFQIDASESHPGWLEFFQDRPSFLQIAGSIGIPAICGGIIWGLMKYPAKRGWLRINPTHEKAGIDESTFHESAYEFQIVPKRLGVIREEIDKLLDQNLIDGFNYRESIQSPVMSSIAPFRRDFSDWLSRVEGVTFDFYRHHGDIPLILNGVQIAPAERQKSVDKAINKLKEIAIRETLEKKGIFDSKFDFLISHLKALRTLISDQIGSDIDALNRYVDLQKGINVQFKDVKNELGDVNSRLDSGAEYWQQKHDEVMGNFAALNSQIGSMAEVIAALQNGPDQNEEDDIAIFLKFYKSDIQWLEELRTQLEVVSSERKFKILSADQIRPGDLIEERVQSYKEDALIVVMLVSPEFMAHEFKKPEIVEIIDRANHHEIALIWIPIKSFRVDETPLSKFKAALDPDFPIAALDEKERPAAWVKVVKAIVDAARR